MVIQPKNNGAPGEIAALRASSPLRSGTNIDRRAKNFVILYGAPGEIRTPDLLVRSQALYPTELRAQRENLGCPAVEDLNEI